MANFKKLNYKRETKKSKSLTRFLENDNIAGYIFISPWIIGFIAFTAIPVLASLWFSFTDYDLLTSPNFIGLDNYKKMFKDDEVYRKSLFVTFYFVFASVPLRLIFALFVAMLLTVKTKISGLYRTVFYIPSIIGGSIAIAVIWKRIFHDDGVLNDLLAMIGIKTNISYLTNEKTAIWTLIILAVWQFGSSMLIFLAGLKQIPDSYYEAAKIDGANKFQNFFKITIPMLTPIIFFNLVMQIIQGFMSFTQSFVITSGKPMNSTLFYSVYMYNRSFKFFEMGYGSAMAWVMLLIIAAFTIIVFKSSGSWVYYETKEDK
ncbi:MAG: sugar ABC transporter permease [Clostridiales bacterium]